MFQTLVAVCKRLIYEGGCGGQGHVIERPTLMETEMADALYCLGILEFSGHCKS